MSNPNEPHDLDTAAHHDLTARLKDEAAAMRRLGTISQEQMEHFTRTADQAIARANAAEAKLRAFDSPAAAAFNNADPVKPLDPTSPPYTCVVCRDGELLGEPGNAEGRGNWCLKCDRKKLPKGAAPDQRGPWYTFTPTEPAESFQRETIFRYDCSAFKLSVVVGAQTHMAIAHGEPSLRNEDAPSLTLRPSKAQLVALIALLEAAVQAHG